MSYKRKGVIDIRKVVARRRRVAELAAQGLKDTQIAAELNITRKVAYADRKANRRNTPPDVTKLLTIEELCERAGADVVPHYFASLLRRYGIRPVCAYGNNHWYAADTVDRCKKAVADTAERRREVAERAAARDGCTTKGRPRHLTEDELNNLGYLCRRVADGERAVDVALRIGLSERQLRGLYNRAKNYGYDYQNRVARLYVDKCVEARKENRPVPTPPAPAYSIAIRLEATRRGVPRDAVAVYDFTGWDAAFAERNKAYWRQYLRPEEMARYNELAELKVRLYNEGGYDGRP